MRILVDHSGYDLMNIGDAAMLQACVTRLRGQWPEAEILVVCHAPSRLATLCPGARPVGYAIADTALVRLLPRKVRLGMEQVWRVAGPYLMAGTGKPSQQSAGRRLTPLRALRSADVVVASGGGYITDVWWWHAAGVLSLLHAAQRRGKPTAMFGQGLGPLTHRVVSRQASAVFPRLQFLSLREGRSGLPLATALGSRAESLRVTGDDALEIACFEDNPSQAGEALGVNVRVASYSGVDPTMARALRQVLLDHATAEGAAIVALPVSRYEDDSDLAAAKRIFEPHDRVEGNVFVDIPDPQSLRRAVSQCRVVVTGSYHAAVFALAQGIPVVCLSRSSYYAGKFGGLASLFPGACQIVGLSEPGDQAKLSLALKSAWAQSEAIRGPTVMAAVAQRELGRGAYERFAHSVGTSCDEVIGRHSKVSKDETPALAIGDPTEVFQPYRMLEVELSSPIAALQAAATPSRVWVLVTLFGEPLGFEVMTVPASGMNAADWCGHLWKAFGAEIQQRAIRSGEEIPHALSPAGVALSAPQSSFLRERADAVAKSTHITVVVCTRDRAGQLEHCLNALSDLNYPSFDVVVVDNAPSSTASRDMIDDRTWPVPLQYVSQPIPGLSWARNAGVAAAKGPIVAFVDDDEEVPTHWLADLARGFTRSADVGCVAGMILPARLDTAAQEWFENFGGHSKGRGFAPALFSRTDDQSPLFPLPPFGAGGNMAFRLEALRSIGGFDVALGAGTPAAGGEDTLALTLTLLDGYKIAYEPAAFVRHNHYSGVDGLSRQMRGYGLGLTAYYAALVSRRPALVPALLLLIPKAAQHLFGQGAAREISAPGLPKAIARKHRAGMILGVYAYTMSRIRQRHAVQGK